MFGVLMLLDIWQERGWGELVELFGDEEECRFPLFDFLKPLPLEWMYVVYLLMCIGEIGLMLGLFYQMSCLLYVVCYWYLFLLDKTRWNNHSYLFGLFGLMFLITDANRYWSLDGLLFKKKRNAHIPLWNYTLFRFQIFLLYFYAGLKKLDLDWVSGYSMHKIADNFVFAPFRLFLTEDQIGYFVVHLGGLIIDLFLGFFLFFDGTRKIAFLIGTSFHLMNSQIFSIGMFPWTCIATMPLFCPTDWPRKMFTRFPRSMSFILPADDQLQRSCHCIYEKEDIKAETHRKRDTSKVVDDKLAPPTRAGLYHKLSITAMIAYICVQCILPYSHGITKGYNNWTNGLYGYSWDMMVHNWQLQHVKITYINKDTGEEGYLNPTAWTPGGRWNSHADMVKQYARCVQEKMRSFDIPNVELYIDVWRALNDRFQQRTYDPRVNILEADWSPFSNPSWTLPLLVDLSDWRGKLAEIQKSIHENVNDTDVVFVADFPGMYLENFLHEDLGNTSVTLLKGEVMVELVDRGKNVTLQEGDQLQLPVNEFHNIHTISDTPSCYMYIFVNTTEVDIKYILGLYDSVMNGTFSGTDQEALEIKKEVDEGPNTRRYKDHRAEKKKQHFKKHMPLLAAVKLWAKNKLFQLNRSLKFTFEAVKSLTTGSSFEEFLNVTLTAEYEESLKQTVQSPQPDPAVTTEGLTDFNLEEDTYVGDL